MRLTTQQLQQLKKMREFREVSPTIARYIRLGWRAYAYLLVVGAAGIIFFLWAGWPAASTFFAGMVLATFLRDLGWYRRMVNSWPLVHEITNWQRVDEILNQFHTPAA